MLSPQALDEKIFLAVHGLQKPSLDPLFAWPTHFGSLRVALVIILILVLWKKREKWFLRYFEAAAPVIITSSAVHLLKLFFKRDRPFVSLAEPPQVIHILFSTPGSYSFPSGHAATAFSTALVLTTCFGVPPVLSYGIAALVGITRLYVGVHYPSDVVIGALAGLTITALYFRTFFPQKSAS